MNSTRPFLKFKLSLKSSLLIAFNLASLSGCSTLPVTKFKHHSFPKGEAFYGNIERAYITLGTVRSKVDFTSLDEAHEESDLCKNYFNKAVRDLVKMAKDKGGDAVIDVKSVVYLEDGRRETYARPECSDDGLEGQILTQGIVIKWKPKKIETPQSVSQI